MKSFENILFIGPNYKNRGGISSILLSYKENITPFSYLKSSTDKGILVNALVLLMLLLKLPLFKWFTTIKILHIHGASRRSFQRKSIIIRWAKFWGFKVVFHFHGGGFKKYVEATDLKTIKKTLDRCNAIIVLSEYWRDYFVQTFNLSHVFVANNMINRPFEVGNKLDGNLHLLFLGLITPEKGIFDLLEVISTHKHELNGRCTLIIGGSGTKENTNKLAHYIKSNGLQEIIDYQGWITGSERHQAFCNSNVFILPSYIEGLPISILEAMANDMPIIASSVGGIPSVVTKENGILIEPGNKQAIWDSLKYYIDNNNLISEHGKESGLLIKSFYPDEVKSQLNYIYSQL